MNNIDLSVRGAIRRIQHIITTDYLPPGLIRDIEIVVEAAISRRDDNGHDVGGNGKIIKFDFGAMVKTARKAKGYSQPKLARLVGTSQQTVDKIESGKVERSSFLPAIFHELGLPLEQLVMARSR
jgi:DNA-binding XRE family transcriptional regulator